ncbi:MAG: peptidoglycan-binding protein [Cohaesibacter sp.]|nr:peptidoglycan-binding protein [Cohaesibacter sp.]MCV6602249.1 peptidoglycan-binding protein [Cohaesibacter sp.]
MSELYDEYKDWDENGQDNPLALIGLVVMALTAGAIISNALFFQPKSAELAMMAEARKAEAAARLSNHAQSVPVPKANQKGQFITPVQSPNQSQLDNQRIAQNRAFANNRTSTILAVQTYLTQSGYYVGPLDGQENIQTKEAVSAYQEAMGLPATGVITAGLHDVLAGKQTIVQYAAKLAIQGSYAGTPQDAVKLAILPKRKPQRRAAQTVSLAGIERNKPVPPENIPEKTDPVLAKVQNALTKWGYAQLTVDGRMGQKTAAAIRSFQRSRGHPETGRVNDRLLKDMIMMGYLDLG